MLKYVRYWGEIKNITDSDTDNRYSEDVLTCTAKSTVAPHGHPKLSVLRGVQAGARVRHGLNTGATRLRLHAHSDGTVSHCLRPRLGAQVRRRTCRNKFERIT